MAHSYVACNVHCVFSTKNRANLIYKDVRPRLFAYMGGIARENGIRALRVGGTDNHAHLLLVIPATMPIAKGVQLLKAGSSKWLSETFPQCMSFSWQEGYGAFSVSASAVPSVSDYIARQDEHHKARTFEDEYLELLRRHGIEYDDAYVFG